MKKFYYSRSRTLNGTHIIDSIVSEFPWAFYHLVFPEEEGKRIDILIHTYYDLNVGFFLFIVGYKIVGYGVGHCWPLCAAKWNC